MGNTASRDHEEGQRKSIESSARDVTTFFADEAKREDKVLVLSPPKSHDARNTIASSPFNALVESQSLLQTLSVQQPRAGSRVSVVKATGGVTGEHHFLDIAQTIGEAIRLWTIRIKEDQMEIDEKQKSLDILSKKVQTMILHRSAEARVFSLQLGELEATYEHIERLSDLIRDAKTKAENIRQLIEAVEEEERFAAEKEPEPLSHPKIPRDMPPVSPTNRVISNTAPFHEVVANLRRSELWQDMIQRSASPDKKD